jgi:pyruvate/2-oxoglutarate/acetoin dehydrogenase E1 component
MPRKHPDISFDILDLRTLLPLDYDAIKASVLRTGKVLLLHEDTLVGGIGGELAAWIARIALKCWMRLLFVVQAWIPRYLLP